MLQSLAATPLVLSTGVISVARTATASLGASKREEVIVRLISHTLAQDNSAAVARDNEAGGEEGDTVEWMDR